MSPKPERVYKSDNPKDKPDPAPYPKPYGEQIDSDNSLNSRKKKSYGKYEGSRFRKKPRSQDRKSA